MKRRKKYVRPTIEVIEVEMEGGIAAGSARVRLNENEQPFEQWETADQDGTLDW